MIKKLTLKIYSLYSRMFQTTKYENVFMNVPVERLTYYPELHEMYMTVSCKDELDTTTYTTKVPEDLMKVVMAHASPGVRIVFLTNEAHIMGHIFFGKESHLEVKKQIDKGSRPAGWANPNDKGWQEWKKRQAEFRSSDPEDNTWGYAKCLVGNPPYLGFRKKEEE